ncbi:MAG: N(4)-(beta-N-acetylglucosaminyl)-L-asparaginase [Dehalococcoidia bacterium]
MTMIVVASANGRVGIEEAVSVLRRGGTALDAVEAGTRLVEDNLDDHSVGSAGLPNLLGEVELDASIMDGRTLATGAVAAIKGYPNPVSIARRVMTELPHVLLAGEGAGRFAAESGFETAELLTEETRRIWRERLEGKVPESYGPGDIAYLDRMRELVTLTTDPEKVAGTVNFIARDRDGAIASAVSTSGWAWKYPGRVGDSPIIGAGNYCDNRYGAATCTGRGEMAIRASTARSVVLYLKAGMSLHDALAEAMRDLWPLEDPYYGGMNIVAVDAAGNHAAAANRPATYIYMTGEMDTYAEAPRTVIPRPGDD